MPSATWRSTACILCECNCGIEVQLGGEDGRRFARIRGDKAHPGSKGYACEKASRLDHYQNGLDRLVGPLRRRPDGSFEAIDWDTAIREVAARLASIRDQHGGESIFYYGGGGQGNHSPGAYSGATQSLLGIRYRSNALAQEKTGEFWVSGKMIGGLSRGDFERCEVAVFVGKNPWMSHGISHARVTLRKLAKDPKRSMIVIDPRRSETADLADFHLQVKPGRDAWLVAAMAAVLVQEDRVDHAFLAAHTQGAEKLVPLLERVDVTRYCEIAGVDEELVRAASRRIAEASSVAVAEDLGVQMNVHSTLLSYLQRFLWMLTGNFGKAGAMYMPTALQPLTGRRTAPSGGGRTSPVVGARIITGLVPCNVIAEEILTDHPKRYRAMIVESANPAHSLADSPRMREALAALDTLVVIDVAMTETARLADYVLPTSTQFEKTEFTLFNFEFPNNVFHLRRPLLAPPDGVLPEAEIHARLVEALGAMPTDALPELRQAAWRGLDEFAEAFTGFVADNPQALPLAPVILYRTLGEALPPALKEGAVLWGACQFCAQEYPDSIRRAGFLGEGPALGNALFEGVLAARSGIVFTVDEFEESFARIRTPGGRLQLWIDELEEAVQGLEEGPRDEDSEYPFVLSAGERRSFTANTIFRDPLWRKKDADGALFLCPEDGERLGVAEGELVRVTTRRGRAEVRVALSDRMQPGHISLPNGLGLDATSEEGELQRVGVAPNELTSLEDRDPYAGTPWHKRVPARVERVA
ncbi:MAG: molybdopterin-dependent oxidoreductase [Proteobacteria bacterium]|nr:molybdopterin-dependent oxidoreductase [Pseudomonadota bacterium]